jgi:serine/threonine protein kinase
MSVDWKKFEGQVVKNTFPLQKLLGSTSHSAVFATQSPPPQPKNLAIKFLRAGAKADSHVSLLLRASQLSHPNILRLLPGGRCRLADMDLIFALMEYAEEDLGQILPAHPLNAEKTRQTLRLLLGALSHIHSKNFAHTHIKPSNIMSVNKHLKLSCDMVLPFGEPRPGDRPLDAYDAPEAGTALVAASSDMWSLGMTLVETLTQQLPASPREGQSDPVVPSSLPEPFLEIARQCLRRDPVLRWTMAQVANCLNPAPVQVAAPVQAAAPVQVAAPEAVASAQTATLTPAVAATGKPMEPASEAWQDIYYCWVVLCKNYFFHMKQNLFFRHRIPLAYTDPYASIPEIDGPFEVRCDDCGKTYVYKRKDLRRYEGEVPKFKTHPLF